MSQRLQRLMGVGSTDDDRLGSFEAVEAFDHGQTATCCRFIDKDKSAVVLTLSDGCCEDLCQILGNDNLLRVHLMDGYGRLFSVYGAKVRKKVKSGKIIVKKITLTLNFSLFTASKRQKLSKKVNEEIYFADCRFDDDSRYIRPANS